jgi:shikimate dehydrogenase
MSSSSLTDATLNPREVYTRADLERWERSAPSLAVLGHPVGHSVSPDMHNAALAVLRAQRPELEGLAYFKFEIEPEELERALDLLREKNFRGVNLTVPHKEHAAKILAKLGRETDEVGKKTLNTLLSGETGWIGRNTDGYGLAQALERDLDVKIPGRSVVILGAGGAAFAAAAEVLRQGCAALWIGNRSGDRLEDLLRDLRALLPPSAPARKSKRPRLLPEAIRGFTLSDPPAADWPADVVLINATTLGMKRDDPVPLDAALLGPQARVLDMVYRRGGKTTPLLGMAHARGLRAADGLSMLVWQGAAALAIWLHGVLQIHLKPQSVAPVMMTAACAALGLKPRDLQPDA